MGAIHIVVRLHEGVPGVLVVLADDLLVERAFLGTVLHEDGGQTAASGVGTCVAEDVADLFYQLQLWGGVGCDGAKVVGLVYTRDGMSDTAVSLSIKGGPTSRHARRGGSEEVVRVRRQPG